jgi:hypothetical protein
MAEILKPATDINHGAGMADIHQYMFGGVCTS